MAEVLSAKTGKITIGDAMLIAVTKSFEEKLTAPLIGNGTLMSGAVKLVGAGAIKNMVGGKVGDIVGTALTVDGAEDIIFSLLGNSSILGAGQSQSATI